MPLVAQALQRSVPQQLAVALDDAGLQLLQGGVHQAVRELVDEG